MRLVGTENAQLDDKRRLAVPAKFRKELGTGDLYVTASMEERCLNIYAESTFTATEDEVKRETRMTAEGRAAWRKVFAFTELVQPDAQGRVVIPARLLARVGIAAPADLVCAGMNEWLEVWERKRYETDVEGND